MTLFPTTRGDGLGLNDRFVKQVCECGYTTSACAASWNAHTLVPSRGSAELDLAESFDSISLNDYLSLAAVTGDSGMNASHTEKTKESLPWGLATCETRIKFKFAKMEKTKNRVSGRETHTASSFCRRFTTSILIS